MNLEFRADGVTLIGVLIANGKAQAVTDTKLGQLARHRRRHHPDHAGQDGAGMVSGLASTGLHQAFKQLVGDN